VSFSLDQLLRDQRDYYRARAPTYETDLYDWPGAAEALEVGACAVPATGAILELACGTGVWTERLLARSADVTAVDASPEMIAIAQARAGGARYVVADLFDWAPTRRYDTVFFGFWLSHVPAEEFASFWQTVRDSLADGGRVVFVDEHVSGADKEHWLEAGVVRRTLPDGSEHRVVKYYVDPAPMRARLADLGWAADITPIADGAWVLGVAQPVRWPEGPGC
jgi:demethylmenaquinone methyltransferase/2-methoxy-6-polyprenyl-1,4-benzoquinol methylase